MATRFKFRLEALLKVRKALEEEAKRHLSRMLAAQDQAQAALDNLRALHLAGLVRCRVAPGQVINLEDLRNTQRFLLVVEQRIQAQTQVLHQAQQAVATARQTLVKAHQNHLILQRLKERRQEQHAREVLQEEIRDLDEIAVLRYHITHPAASNL